MMRSMTTTQTERALVPGVDQAAELDALGAERKALPNQIADAQARGDIDEAIVLDARLRAVQMRFEYLFPLVWHERDRDYHERRTALIGELRAAKSEESKVVADAKAAIRAARSRTAQAQRRLISVETEWTYRHRAPVGLGHHDRGRVGVNGKEQEALIAAAAKRGGTPIDDPIAAKIAPHPNQHGYDNPKHLVLEVVEMAGKPEPAQGGGTRLPKAVRKIK